MSSPGNCVFLFDTSGVMAAPWAAAGYKCHCYDLQNDGRVEGNITFHQWDAHGPELPVMADLAFVACWPVCTHLSISGARWFKGKGLRALSWSILNFAICAEYCEASGAPYLIENPMSTITTYWRAPDHRFHPCNYNAIDPAASYTKETWLWVGGGFIMPPFSMEPDLFIDREHIHHQSPGPERANIRSLTPPGFPIAVFNAQTEKKYEH